MKELCLKNISKSFSKNNSPVIDNLNLEIEEGKITALLGPSGCGKTTILKIIAGLLPPSKGKILYNGENITNLPPEKREAVMVFQNHLLFPYMNVEENISFGLKIRHLKKDLINFKVKEILSLVKLEGYEKRKPSELSGGQKQRVALARALVLRPKILLLDEPFSNLDAHLRDEMRELIITLHKKFKTTTIFVTHNQSEAVSISNRIALIFDGKLQQYSKANLFFEQPVSKKVASFFGNNNFLSGIKTGNSITTSIGNFETINNNVPDGKVTLIVRPEAIAICEDNCNCFKAKIKKQNYFGTYSQYSIKIDGKDWIIRSDPNYKKNLEGKTVSLKLPTEKIWVLKENETVN